MYPGSFYVWNWGTSAYFRFVSLHVTQITHDTDDNSRRKLEMLTFIPSICVFSFLTLLQTRSSFQTSSASILSRLYSQKLSVIDGHFGNSYTNHTNENSTVIYKFEYKEIENKVRLLRSHISFKYCHRI